MRSVVSYGADNYPNAPADPEREHRRQRLHGHRPSDRSRRSTTRPISTVPGAPFVINPAGFAASSTDFCLTAVAGRWIAVQHGPGGGISVGTLFTPGTCTVS